MSMHGECRLEGECPCANHYLTMALDERDVALRQSRVERDALRAEVDRLTALVAHQDRVLRGLAFRDPASGGEGE